MQSQCLIVAIALLSFGGPGAGFCWPQSNAEARSALVKLRNLVEPLKDMPMGAAAKAASEIELEICVMDLYTGVTGPFFADRKGDKLVVGHLKQGDLKAFVVALREIRPHAIQLLSRPVLRTTSGQTAYVGSKSPALIGGTLTSGLVWQPHAVLLEVTPTLRDAGHLSLDMNIELSKAVWSPAHDVRAEPNYEVTGRASAHSYVRPGETLVVGGLKQKRTSTEVRQIPLLCRLPGVGSRFEYSTQETHEIELLVLVTPRLVAPRPEQKPNR